MQRFVHYRMWTTEQVNALSIIESILGVIYIRRAHPVETGPWCPLPNYGIHRSTTASREYRHWCLKNSRRRWHSLFSVGRFFMMYKSDWSSYECEEGSIFLANKWRCFRYIRPTEQRCRWFVWRDLFALRWQVVLLFLFWNLIDGLSKIHTPKRPLSNWLIPLAIEETIVITICFFYYSFLFKFLLTHTNFDN